MPSHCGALGLYPALGAGSIGGVKGPRAPTKSHSCELSRASGGPHLPAARAPSSPFHRYCRCDGEENSLFHFAIHLTEQGFPLSKSRRFVTWRGRGPPTALKAPAAQGGRVRSERGEHDARAYPRTARQHPCRWARTRLCGRPVKGPVKAPCHGKMLDSLARWRARWTMPRSRWQRHGVYRNVVRSSACRPFPHPRHAIHPQ
jgi:hypothetical protein